MSGLMLRVCPDSSNCPPFDPIGNFSSEVDDSLDYIKTVWEGPVPPPLLKDWTATECGFTYVSHISQLDADLNAAAGAILCINTDHQTTVVVNGPQTCCVSCPDGFSQSCYTLPGGMIVGLNQYSVDQQAYQLACQLVRDNPVCIGNIKGCACINVPFSTSVSANTIVIWSLNGGSLPPGLTFDAGLAVTTTISGTPLASGQYNFELKALAPGTGVYTTKQFSITVLEITSTSLPAYTIGVPYSYQLQVAGGSGNYNWKITAGSLPNGLTMSITGLISGTPI